MIDKRVTLRRLITLTVVAIGVPLSGCGALLTAPATVTSLAVWGTTGKTPSDHAVSGVAGQDCSLFRALDSQSVCTSAPSKRAEIVNLNTPVTNAAVLR